MSRFWKWVLGRVADIAIWARGRGLVQQAPDVPGLERKVGPRP